MVEAEQIQDPVIAGMEVRRALRAEFWALPPEAHVDRKTVAAVRYIESQTLELEAIKGGGIPYMRVSRRVYYRKADVLAWIEANATKGRSTAELSQ